MPELQDTCFGCIPLRAGVLTIGYVNLFSLLVSLLAGLEVMSRLYDDETDENDHMTKYFSGMVAAISLPIGLSMLLIIGAHKKKPYLLRIYHYTEMFSFYVYIVALSLIMIFVLAKTRDFSVLLMIIPIAIIFAIEWYFMNVVHRAYKEMEEKQNRTYKVKNDNSAS